MIFVIGLWTFLRAMLFGSAAVAIENLLSFAKTPSGVQVWLIDQL